MDEATANHIESRVSALEANLSNLVETVQQIAVSQREALGQMAEHQERSIAQLTQQQERSIAQLTQQQERAVGRLTEQQERAVEQMERTAEGLQRAIRDTENRFTNELRSILDRQQPKWGLYISAAGLLFAIVTSLAALWIAPLSVRLEAATISLAAADSERAMSQERIVELRIAQARLEERLSHPKGASQ